MRISVLGSEVRVFPVPVEMLPAGARALYDPLNRVITYYESDDDAVTTSALTHEVLHVINDLAALQLTHSQIAALAHALTTVRSLD